MKTALTFLATIIALHLALWAIDAHAPHGTFTNHIIHPPENPLQVTHQSSWSRWIYFPDSDEIHLNKRKWDAIKGVDYP